MAAFLQTFEEGQSLVDLVGNVSFPARSCYDDVLSALQTDCEHANEAEKKAISLRLARCYFNISGHINAFPFSEPEETQASRMSAASYSIYTIVKLHWKNMCLFAKQLTFTEQTSESLVDLLNTMISSSLAIQKLQGDLLKVGMILNRTVTEIQQEMVNTTADLRRLSNMFVELDQTLSILTSFLDFAILTGQRLKFYLGVGLFILTIGIFVPGLVRITVFAWICAIFGDRMIAMKWQSWSMSNMRIIIIRVWGLSSCAYPVFCLYRYICDFGRRVSMRGKSRSSH
jgi:hypothetical protein